MIMAEVLQQKDLVIGLEISVNGNKLKDDVEIDEIRIQTEINKIASATIVIKDGGIPGLTNNPFMHSEGSDFLPGNDIEISLGYGSETEEIFKGVIISQRLMVRNGNSQLLIQCKDKAIQMTRGRFNAIYQDQTDADVIKKVVDKYGLDLSVDATNPVLPQNMQYNCSDWDFVLIRAEANNMVVITDKNRLSIKKFNFSDSAKYEINATQFNLEIDLSLDSETLAKSYTLTAWNEKEQEKSEVSVSLSDDISQGDVSAQKLSGVVIEESEHFTSASLSKDELKLWGETLSNKAVMSKIKGKITVPGSTGLAAGDLIVLSGFSTRFNGKAYVSGVETLLEEGSWKTILTLGKSPSWQSELPDVEDLSASGLIPGVSGFQIGKVKKIDEDPEGKYRVLVTLPCFSGTGQEDGIWARQLFPYASNEAGFFFYPEIDDEVLLGFLNNDPRHAVIIGSLYNGINKPKETPDDMNQFKSIYSRSGIYIRFDDEDKILTIETPGGNSIKLDDNEKAITINDVSLNSVVLNDSGITLDSPKDINLKANGNISISASSGINLKANSDLNAEGTNIQMTAQVGLTAKGNATAEISASGQTTVKGAMVMIN